MSKANPMMRKCRPRTAFPHHFARSAVFATARPGAREGQARPFVPGAETDRPSPSRGTRDAAPQRRSPRLVRRRSLLTGGGGAKRQLSSTFVNIRQRARGAGDERWLRRARCPARCRARTDARPQGFDNLQQRRAHAASRSSKAPHGPARMRAAAWPGKGPWPDHMEHYENSSRGRKSGVPVCSSAAGNCGASSSATAQISLVRTFAAASSDGRR
jgi:hypothetical protein